VSPITNDLSYNQSASVWQDCVNKALLSAYGFETSDVDAFASTDEDGYILGRSRSAIDVFGAFLFFEWKSYGDMDLKTGQSIFLSNLMQLLWTHPTSRGMVVFLKIRDALGADNRPVMVTREAPRDSTAAMNNDRPYLAMRYKKQEVERVGVFIPHRGLHNRYYARRYWLYQSGKNPHDTLVDFLVGWKNYNSTNRKADSAKGPLHNLVFGGYDTTASGELGNYETTVEELFRVSHKEEPRPPNMFEQNNEAYN
tara:strand:+ start:1844 stop:2605 length:762 start_codon:yes stop_codon:yes gene_type:complete